MQTIFELKEQAITDTPLLVFDCVLASGQRERWSTHGVTVGEETYEARVLHHNVFEIQTSSGQGVDGIPADLDRAGERRLAFFRDRTERPGGRARS